MVGPGSAQRFAAFANWTGHAAPIRIAESVAEARRGSNGTYGGFFTHHSTGGGLPDRPGGASSAILQKVIHNPGKVGIDKSLSVRHGAIPLQERQ